MRPVKTKIKNALYKNKLEDRKAKVIAVFGSKGGVGKTTVAVNLATVLAKNGFRTALLDFDIQFGDASIFLDLENKHGISELVQEGTLSCEMVQSYMILHKTGLSLLAASERPEYAEMVKSSHGESIIDSISKGYDFILIDLPTQMNDLSLLALEKANTILQIINPDISTLRNAKKTLELMKALKIDHKVEIVLNKENASTITAKEITSLMKLDFIVKIPVESKHSVASLNQGVPVVLNVPKCTMSKKIIQLGEIIGENNYGAVRKA